MNSKVYAPIDPGCLSVVETFWKLGINTLHSCSGLDEDHLNRIKSKSLNGYISFEISDSYSLTFCKKFIDNCFIKEVISWAEYLYLEINEYGEEEWVRLTQNYDDRNKWNLKIGELELNPKESFVGKVSFYLSENTSECWNEVKEILLRQLN